MLDMVDGRVVHGRARLLLRDGILRTHAEAEQPVHWTLSAHPEPGHALRPGNPDRPPTAGRPPAESVGTICLAETTSSAADVHEFIVQYQIPIMATFGLAAYGCCEDLTQKIGLLRHIPNLRRIAVAPVADVARCAEQIGDEYVLSYRPSPTDMVGYGFDADRARAIMQADLEACRPTGHVDITSKDSHVRRPDGCRVGSPGTCSMSLRLGPPAPPRHLGGTMTGRSWLPPTSPAQGGTRTVRCSSSARECSPIGLGAENRWYKDERAWPLERIGRDAAVPG